MGIAAAATSVVTAVITTIADNSNSESTNKNTSRSNSCSDDIVSGGGNFTGRLIMKSTKYLWFSLNTRRHTCY